MKFNRFLGNIVSRLIDTQMSRIQTLLLRFITYTIGILCIVLIFLKLFDHSLAKGEYIDTITGSFLLKHSSSFIYQHLLDLAIPITILFVVIVAPLHDVLFIDIEPCEDFKPHTTDTHYSEEDTINKLVNNLTYEGYKIAYGINNSNHFDDWEKYYLEAININKKYIFQNEYIYIRIYVYNQENFHDINNTLNMQIEDSIINGKSQFSKLGNMNSGYILPIFIFKNTDLETKKFIVKNYAKDGNVRILPCLYNGSENYWFHKRTKRPIILSILKKLERSINKKFSNEDFEYRYNENNYFLKGRGYSDYKLGVEYFEKGKYKKAIKYLLNAIKVSKNHKDLSHAYIIVGICYDHLELLDEAIQSYNRSITFNSKNHLNLRCLAFLYMNIGNYQEAIQYIESYVAACPDDEIALLNYGVILLKLQLYSKSILILEQYIQLNTKDIDAFMYLSIAYANTGDMDLSEEYYNKGIELTCSSLGKKQSI